MVSAEVTAFHSPGMEVLYMFCRQRGRKLSEGKHFCVNCGAKVNAVVEPVMATSAAQTPPPIRAFAEPEPVQGDFDPKHPLHAQSAQPPPPPLSVPVIPTELNQTTNVLAGVMLIVAIIVFLVFDNVSNASRCLTCNTDPATSSIFVPILQPGSREFSPGFSAAGNFVITAGYIYLQPGATASYSLTVPEGSSQTVSYGTLAGHVVNNGPVDVFIDGVMDTRITQGVGGYGETSPRTLILWTHVFPPGAHLVTLRSVSDSVNVYGLWFGTAQQSGQSTQAMTKTVTIDLPVVGCPLVDMSGPQPVSVPDSLAATIPGEWASALSFYSDEELWVLGPKGWRCSGGGGTGGVSLDVTREPLPSTGSDAHFSVEGVFVVLYGSSTGPGASSVLSVGGRLFPLIRELAKVAALNPQTELFAPHRPIAPWPGEKIEQVSPTVIRFYDPPAVKGTGKFSGRGNPVEGVAVLTEDGGQPVVASLPSLVVVSVSLPPSDRSLTKPILDDAIQRYSK
jgi:hypothetical protein